jgi:hypothetical protein
MGNHQAHIFDAGIRTEAFQRYRCFGEFSQVCLAIDTLSRRVGRLGIAPGTDLHVNASEKFSLIVTEKDGST